MSSIPLDSAVQEVEERILAPLKRLRRQARLYIVLDGLVRFAIALVAAGATQLVLDRWLKLSLDQRALFNVGITIFWLSVLYRKILVRVVRPISDSLLAAAVDRANPQLHDNLSTAVQFAAGSVGDEQSNSPALVRAVLNDACRAAGGVDFTKVLDHGRARSAAARLAGVVLAILTPTLLMPELMGTWFKRNWLMQDVPWPQATYLRPVGYDGEGRRRVPAGDPLEVVAQITGETPDEVLIEWWTPNGEGGNETMTLLVGDRRAKATLGAVTEAVHFRLSGGDERTREYVAEAIERPAIVRTVVHVEPPAYTGLPQTVLEQQTVIELLRGSRLRIMADLNKPVKSAKLTPASGEGVPTALVAPDRVLVDWADPVSGSYVFELVDLDGWENRRTVRYSIKVVPDQPPVVKLTVRDIGDVVTPQAELPIEAAFSDVYGLSRVSLFAQRNEDAPENVPLAGFSNGQREFRSEVQYAIAGLGAAAGQPVRLWAEAADVDPAGPNLGKSQPVELRVLTPTEFLAEMAGRELELRQEFERLISEQNGLRDALEKVTPTLPVSGVMPTQAAQRLGGLARRQEAHAARVLSIKRGFERILAEMRTSRVLRPVDERRIGERIVTPLDRIGSESMPAASGMLNELRREADAGKAARVPTAQVELLKRMKAVLADMLENEGYREAVALLQEIIQHQGDVHAATVEALAKEIEAIIGLESPTSAPTTRPRP